MISGIHKVECYVVVRFMDIINVGLSRLGVRFGLCALINFRLYGVPTVAITRFALLFVKLRDIGLLNVLCHACACISNFSDTKSIKGRQ